MKPLSAKHEVTTRAAVIDRASTGEGSVRVSLYTEHAGLVAAFAKSGREERSKLRPHLQTGSYGSYTLVRGARGWRAVGAVGTKNPYFTHGAETEGKRAASSVLIALRQLIHGEESNAELFNTLWDFLNALPHLTPETTSIAERLAMVRILSALGYVPVLADMPHLAEATFTDGALCGLKPLEKRMVRIINDALVASELV